MRLKSLFCRNFKKVSLQGFLRWLPPIDPIVSRSLPWTSPVPLAAALLAGTHLLLALLSGDGTGCCGGLGMLRGLSHLGVGRVAAAGREIDVNGLVLCSVSLGSTPCFLAESAQSAFCVSLPQPTLGASDGCLATLPK